MSGTFASIEPSEEGRKEAPLILLVDDDTDLRELLEWSIKRTGWRVEAAADGAAALEWIETHRPDVLVVDLGLPFHDGEAVAAFLRSSYGHDVPIIVVSGDEHVAAAARRMEAYDYLRKPFSVSSLLDAIRLALEEV